MKERLEVMGIVVALIIIYRHCESNDENKGHSCLLPCSSNEALMY